jgi:hypothetical protein
MSCSQSTFSRMLQLSPSASVETRQAADVARVVAGAGICIDMYNTGKCEGLGGKQTRKWIQTRAQQGNGRACEAKHGTVQTEDCNESCQNCKGEWGSWGTCTKDCGTGKSSRAYSIKEMALGQDATKCPYANGHREEKTCNTQCCPVDCDEGWSSYSPCSAECGEGTMTRLWVVARPTACGGKQCTRQHGTREQATCNLAACWEQADGSMGACKQEQCWSKRTLFIPFLCVTLSAVTVFIPAG